MKIKKEKRVLTADDVWAVKAFARLRKKLERKVRTLSRRECTDENRARLNEFLQKVFAEAKIKFDGNYRVWIDDTEGSDWSVCNVGMFGEDYYPRSGDRK